MARRGAVEVRVENQLVRYTAPEPFGHDEVVEQLGGKRNGKVIIIALKSPRATLQSVRELRRRGGDAVSRCLQRSCGSEGTAGYVLASEGR